MAKQVFLIDTFYSNYYFRRLSLLFPSSDYAFSFGRYPDSNQNEKGYGHIPWQGAQKASSYPSYVIKDLRWSGTDTIQKGKQKSPGRAKSRSRSQPPTPGGRKNVTQINVCIVNTQMHDKHKDQLTLPQQSDQNAKRTEETHRQRAGQDQSHILP